MAAWVASGETWELFADAWLAELARRPAIRHFKHYEAKQREGQFEGWENTAINEKLLALAKVICKYKPLYGISTGLLVRKLKEDIGRTVLPRKKPRKYGVLTEPYEFCFIDATCRILQVQLERQIGGRVDFIFDDHALFEKCAALYRNMQQGFLPAEQKAIAGTVSSAVDTDVPALQAADLLAGQMTSSLRFGKHDAPLKLMRDSIDIYVAPSPLPRHMGANEIFEAMNVLWSVHRLSKVQNKPST